MDTNKRENIGNLLNKGLSLLKNDQIISSLNKFNEVVSESNTKELNDLKLQALISASVCYSRLYKFDNSLRCLESAKEIAEITNDFLALGKIHLNQGGVEFHTGKIEGALSSYHLALINFDKADNDLGRLQSFSNLALIYLDLESYRLAFHYFDNAEQITESSKELIYDRILLKNNIAKTLYHSLLRGIKDEYLNPHDLFKREIESALYNAEINKFKSLIIECLITSSNYEREFGDINNSLKSLKNALSISIEINSYPKQSIIYGALGNTFAITEEYYEAITNYLKARELKLSLNDTKGLLVVLINLSHCYLKVKNFNKAFEAASEARLLLDQLLMRINSSEKKINFKDSFFSIFRNLLFSNLYGNTNLDLPEFLENFFYPTSVVNINYKSSRDDIEREIYLRKTILNTIDIREKIYSDYKKEKISNEQLKLNIYRAIDKQKKAVIELENNNNNNRTDSDTEVFSSISPQKLLNENNYPDNSTVLYINYSEIFKEFYLIFTFFDKEKESQFVVKVKKQELEKIFHNAIRISDMYSIIGREILLTDISKYLGSVLNQVSYFKENNTTEKILILILDGFLSYLPWEIAKFEDSFWGAKYAISRNFSCSHLNFLHKQVTQVKIDSPKVHIYCPFPSQLEFSETEAKSVYAISKKKFPNSKTFIGKHSNSENFLNSIADTNLLILHFCGHSTFNNRDPFLSTLQMKDNNNKNRAIYNLEIIKNTNFKNLPLIFLNSCDSGRMHIKGSNDSFGFIKSLLDSGANSIIASNWTSLDSPSIVAFTKCFYKQLLTKDSNIAECLVKARNKTIETTNNKSNKFGFFTHWGGTIQFGNPLTKFN